MAQRILVTPDELRDSSSKFKKGSNDVTTLLEQLRTEVGSLEQVWDGAAQDSFFQAFHQMDEQLKMFPQILDGISQQLTMVAQTIEETDAQIASQLKA